MKKFVETFWGKIIFAAVSIIATSILLILMSILIIAWNQPEINRQLKREIKIGDSIINEKIQVRDNVLIDKIEGIINNTDKLIQRFDRHIDKSKN